MSAAWWLLTWGLAASAIVLYLRGSSWKREWEELGLTHARTLDELANLRVELECLTGNPLAGHTLNDPSVKAYDAARHRPHPVVLGVPAAPPERLVPPRWDGYEGAEIAPFPLSGMPPGERLGPPGPPQSVETSGRRPSYACRHGWFLYPCPSCWTGDPTVGETVRPVRDLSHCDGLG